MEPAVLSILYVMMTTPAPSMSDDCREEEPSHAQTGRSGRLHASNCCRHCSTEAVLWHSTSTRSAGSRAHSATASSVLPPPHGTTTMPERTRPSGSSTASSAWRWCGHSVTDGRSGAPQGGRRDNAAPGGHTCCVAAPGAPTAGIRWAG